MPGFTNKLLPLQWENQHLQPQQKFICWLINKLQYLRHYTLQKFANDLLMTFTHLENLENALGKLFSSHNNLNQNMEEESPGELAFLGTLLKCNNGNISVYIGI